MRELERRGPLRGRDRIVLVNADRGEVLTNKRLRELLLVDSGQAREIQHRLRDEGAARSARRCQLPSQRVTATAGRATTQR